MDIDMLTVLQEQHETHQRPVPTVDGIRTLGSLKILVKLRPAKARAGKQENPLHITERGT